MFPFVFNPCVFSLHQSTSPLFLFGSYFPFSHNPVLWRNAGSRQLCVLSRPSCVDLTRQSQTCWRQPPYVIHSPQRSLQRSLPLLADGLPALSRTREERGEALNAWVGYWGCHSQEWTCPLCNPFTATEVVCLLNTTWDN